MFIANFNWVTYGIARNWIDDVDEAVIISSGPLRVGYHPGANNMRVAPLIDKVALDPVGQDELVNPRRHPVKKEIAANIGVERDRAPAIDLRELKREIAYCLLIGDNS